MPKNLLLAKRAFLLATLFCVFWVGDAMADLGPLQAPLEGSAKGTHL